MIIHFLKVAFRIFIRYSSYTVINILGLAVGVASSIIIFLYVERQISSAPDLTGKTFKNPPMHAGMYAEPRPDNPFSNKTADSTVFTDSANDKASTLVPAPSPWIIKYKNEFETGKDRAFGYMLTVLAVMILIVSCLNFINLTTARSAIRIKEIVVRKIAGSERKTLVRQFLLESSILAVIAVILALFLTELFLPLFNRYMDLDLNLSYLVDKWGIILVMVFILTIGIVSGLYPAYDFSAADPASILHRNFRPEVRKGNLRWLLVFFQFFIASALTAMALILFCRYRSLLHQLPGTGNPFLPLRDSARIFMLLSAAAVWIACFGLYSLLVFRYCAHKKEIGIRKTLGASSMNIFLSEWKRIGELVLFSSAISWPVVYFAVRAWFSDFHGQTSINPLHLLIPALSMLVIGIIVTAYPVYLAINLSPYNYDQQMH